MMMRKKKRTRDDYNRMGSSVGAVASAIVVMRTDGQESESGEVNESGGEVSGGQANACDEESESGEVNESGGQESESDVAGQCGRRTWIWVRTGGGCDMPRTWSRQCAARAL
jgi:hypothetical protein